MKPISMINKLLAFSLLLCVSVALSSCHDDENESPVLPGNYHYLLNIPNSDDELLVILDSISSPIKTIGTCPDWAVASMVDNMENEHPALRFLLKRGEPNTLRKGQVIVESEKGDKVTLSLIQAAYIVDDNNSDEDFLSDWESKESITIYSNGKHQNVNLPWAKESITTLPGSIRRDIKKKDGWEMAFSILNNESLEDCNYFALYNRYLGTLRIFHYVSNATTTGSKYSFEVNMGSANKKHKYPFYHALTYAIPSNHSKLNTTTNLLGNGIPSALTFKSFYSPYTVMSSTALSKGWTAFDIDVSAYNPSESGWLNSQDELSIWCKTELQQQISLEGALKANISGKFSSAEQSASASSGVGSMLSTLGGILGDVQDSALAGLDNAITGSPFNQYFYYAGAVCNVAGFAYDYLMKNEYEENIVDSMPGKIEMNLTGDINLSGYISSLSSNNVTSLTMDVGNLKKYNSHLGQGVWSLAEDPIVYVVDDCILGDVNRINLTVNKDGSYGNAGVADYHLRMISFLDPTSVKLNINRNVFPDVSDVKVTCNYGVYPDVAHGHTSKYVQLLGLNRPRLKIVKSGENIKTYQSLSSKNKTKYIKLPRQTIKSDFMDSFQEAYSVTKQAGASYSYYGKKVMSDGKNFIMDPQVYLPVEVTEKSSNVFDGVIPDFVVLVTVSFNSDGRTFIFSQRFLPQIKTITTSELNAEFKKLNDYAKKCREGEAAGSLQNNSNVKVKSPMGDKFIEKTLAVIREIIKK